MSRLPTLEFTPAPDTALRAIVAIPVRNEAQLIWRCLSSLAAQTDLGGGPLDRLSYEVLLVLNNCTDDTAAAISAFEAAVPSLRLLTASVNLPFGQAHVGTARRLAMDAACRRLVGRAHPLTAILTTDADTEVAPDWIAANLAEIEEGADAVAGRLDLEPQLNGLPQQLGAAVRLHMHYETLLHAVTKRESANYGDGRGRGHRFGNGASIAVTPDAYRRTGGLPPLPFEEDVAFCRNIEAASLRLARSNRVRVRPALRLDGRAGRGMASTLAGWKAEVDAGREIRVPHPLDASSLPIPLVKAIDLLEALCGPISATAGSAGPSDIDTSVAMPGA